MQSISRLAFVMCFGLTFLAAETPLPELDTYLRRHLAFTTSELSALEAGQVVVKLPKTAETREVAAFGIVRLDVPEEFFLKQMRDIVQFKKSENVLQIGKFSDPPRLEDLSGLTLDSAEIDTIRHCKVGKCDFKMSARMIERFRREVNWLGPDYRERVTVLTRQMLLEHVEAYLRGGNAALGEYNDKSYKLRLADEFQSLLQPAPYMYAYGPDFQNYLQNFPQTSAPHVENFVYWSKEKFGLKPVVSLTHVTVYKASLTEGTDLLIASKGIYANHYFEASLGVTAFIHRKSSALPPRTYLIYMNRSKTDALRGFLAGLKRSLINGRLREGAKKNMEATKVRVETEYRQ